MKALGLLILFCILFSIANSVFGGRHPIFAGFCALGITSWVSDVMKEAKARKDKEEEENPSQW